VADVTVIYSAIVVHDMAGSATVSGRLVSDRPVTGRQITEFMIDGLLNGDLPPEWGWTREKIDVVRLLWTDIEVPEDPEVS
jgi:hypothetical protein